MNKILRLILVICMILSPMTGLHIPEAYAGPDYEQHWGAGAVSRWIQEGLISGYPDGTFRPDEPVTRAEFITMANRVTRYMGDPEKETVFSDTTGSEWFFGEIAKAVTAGYVSGYPDGTIRPEEPVSRQEAAAVLATLRNLEMDPAAELPYTDSREVPQWSRGHVGAATAMGYMSGYPDGRFRPQAGITRAEAVSALNRVLELEGVIMAHPGVYGPASGQEKVTGNVYVLSDRAELRNLHISGDLIVSEKVGEGSVRLTNLTVRGNTYIRGGGPESVYIENGEYRNIFIQKEEGRIRLVMTSARGATVLLSEESGVTEVILSGDFENIRVRTGDMTVRFLDGSTVGNLIVQDNIENVTIQIPDGTEITRLSADSPVHVINQGKIIEAVGPFSRTSSYEENIPENLRPRPSGGGGTVPVSRYTLTLEPEPPEGGTVTGTGIFEAGEEIEISAQPAEGYRFTGWYLGEDLLSAESEYTYFMPQMHASLSACFEEVHGSPFAGGNGTHADPYRVATAEQLDEVRNHLDKQFVQTADIDLSGYGNWIPMGVSQADSEEVVTAFSGTYNGGGYEISGLTINHTGNYVGLFARLRNYARLENIRMTDVSVNGEGTYIGSLAGSVENTSSVSGCSVTGEVYGTGAAIGGLTGLLNSFSGISECYAYVSVMGTSGESAQQTYTGGLTGSLGGTSHIRTSAVSGTVAGNTLYTGGVSGGMGVADITDSYFRGDISGAEHAGGIAGHVIHGGEIENSYAVSAVSVSGTSSPGGLVGSLGSGSITSSFFDQDVSGLEKPVGNSTDIDGRNKTTADMVMVGTYAGWNFGPVWSIHEGLSYPYLSGLQDQSIPYAFFAGGIGTLEDPYHVATAVHLDHVRKPEFKGAYFKQTADIDLGLTPWNDGAGWVPIQHPDNAFGPGFSGTYDGGGFVIRGLTIDRGAGTGGINAGLFGRILPGGTIVNVHIRDASIIQNTNDPAGILAGTNEGSISFCSTGGSVQGRKFVGGLVGRSGKSGEITNATITDSYSTASISQDPDLISASYFGGLAGVVYQGTEVINCYSAGSVEAGPSATILGGLIGVSEGTVTSSYYDSQVSGRSDDSGKGMPRTTEEMRNQETYTGWNFDSVWGMNGGYPYLRNQRNIT